MSNEVIAGIIAVAILVGLAVLFAIVLSYASDKFAVKSNNEELIKEVEEHLPGYNCGACGKINCYKVAKGIVEKEITDASICKTLSDSSKEELVNFCASKGIKLD